MPHYAAVECLGCGAGRRLLAAAGQYVLELGQQLRLLLLRHTGEQVDGAHEGVGAYFFFFVPGAARECAAAATPAE